MILSSLSVGQLGTNCYIIGCEETLCGIVVDPGGDAPRILEAVEEARLQIERIILTHFHFDHTLATEAVRQGTGATVAIHALEDALLRDPPALYRSFLPGVDLSVTPDALLQDGDVIEVGLLRAQVLHTPGHSPGGTSLWLPAQDTVLTGDALFRRGVGRADFPNSDPQVLAHSIRERLYRLPPETVAYPGHGPATTIGEEMQSNPWVRAVP